MCYSLWYNAPTMLPATGNIVCLHAASLVDLDCYLVLHCTSKSESTETNSTEYSPF